MSGIDRRLFLAGLAAAPAVHGLTHLHRLLESEPAWHWLDGALARMSSGGRFGVALRVPTDADARMLLGRRLFALTELDDEDHEAHDLFCEAVFIVLPEALWQKRFPRQGDADRVLLPPDGGEPLAADRTGPDVYADASKFSASFRPFIRGADGARLEERGRAVEAAMPADLRGAAAALGAEDGGQRARALLALRPALESIQPWVAWKAERGSGDLERREARGLWREHFRTLSRHEPGGRLPYGTTMLQFVQGGCGGWRAVVPGEGPEMLSIACGMARRSKRSGKFVSFLAR